MRKILQNKYIKLVLYGIGGSIAGYGYYYFIGCSNGCPLSSNWAIMTAYGAAAGILLGLPKKS